MAQKWVYGFGNGKAEGKADMKNLLGGKGANLAEMSSIGLPVPPGFTITTEVCTHFYANKQQYPDSLKAEVEKALAAIEKTVECKFGDPANPLLVSVRSGARASMPGMMDTVLNLGLNDVTVQGLAKRAGDERFAWDSYRRFITMYSDVVLGLERHEFEDVLDTYKRRNNLTSDTQVKAEAWKNIVAEFKQIVKQHLKTDFPQDPQEQLWGAIGAVFKSWMTPRAITYRQIHNIPE
ncbi:MAG: pyruvate, phosphate dikinase, partial [Alphaproteobacteria bacterium]|nr:pyruvate, phosphate dikinase [Alphaproteobacteria bacterium]